jgi:predicted metal-dependent hydrolase
MSKKSIEIASIGPVAFYKRRGARHIRLSISHNGEVRVSLPAWAPYQAGVDFVRSKAEWIRTVRVPHALLLDGQAVGKAHILRFVRNTQSKVATRVQHNTIFVGLPQDVQPESEPAQKAASKAITRALRSEAEDILPARLKDIAQLHGFTYRSVQIKKLKGRWGSCSEQRDIVLNCYLMTLPWELIDYVLVHELVHTRIMAHGRPFWEEVAKYVPELAQKRKAIKAHRPIL